MDNSVATALAITVVGMTLLFLTLVFFYGLMALITAVLKDPAVSPVRSTEDAQVGLGEQEAMLRAAAIAVTLARAGGEPGVGLSAMTLEGEGDGLTPTSPWWAIHHQRRLRPDSNVRRVS